MNGRREVEGGEEVRVGGWGGNMVVSHPWWNYDIHIRTTSPSPSEGRPAKEESLTHRIERGIGFRVGDSVLPIGLDTQLIL